MADSQTAVQKEADDLLRECAEENADNYYLVEEKRATALKNGDSQTLSNMDSNMTKDCEPLYKMLDDQQDKAFNEITDENGRKVFIVSTADAALWVYVEQDETAKSAAPAADRDNTVFKPRTQIGVMTKNGAQATFSVSFLKDNLDHFTITAFATGIGYIVGRQITAAITKRAAEAAAVAAAGAAREAAYAELKAARELPVPDPARLQRAIANLRQARAGVNDVWLRNLPRGGIVDRFANLAGRFPRLTSFLGGLITTIIITIVFEVVWQFISKDLYIDATIWNWDSVDWEVNDWYHDNGIISGGGNFETKKIKAATKNQITPWGNKAGNWKTASFVQYLFQNSFTVLDGVGIGLRAQSGDKKNGLAMGYLCSFLKDNQLTIKPEYPSSIKDFYWDKSKWPSDRPTKVSCEVTGGDGKKIKVDAFTNALSGASGNVYKYTVNIGDAMRPAT